MTFRTFALLILLALVAAYLLTLVSRSEVAEPEPTPIRVDIDQTTTGFRSFSVPTPQPTPMPDPTARPATTPKPSGATVSGGVIRCVGYSVPLAAGANVEEGRRQAAARGWVGPEWVALHHLWSCESGWKRSARNPSSGACGIAQRHPCGGRGSWSASEQIRDGLDYIRGRYGVPSRAWTRFRARGSY